MKKSACVIIGIVLIIGGILEFSGAIKDIFDPGEKDDRIVTVGETIKSSEDVEYCITEVKNQKSIGEGYTKQDTTSNFAVIKITIANKGTEPQEIAAQNLLLTDGKNSYEYSREAMILFEDYIFMDTLNPGVSKEYTIVYEIPTETDEKDYKMKICKRQFSENNVVYISLNGKSA